MSRYEVPEGHKALTWRGLSVRLTEAQGKLERLRAHGERMSAQRNDERHALRHALVALIAASRDEGLSAPLRAFIHEELATVGRIDASWLSPQFLAGCRNCRAVEDATSREGGEDDVAG